MSDTPNKFYLTTPIYYVNARPHIGHAYTTIAADVIARRHRLLGDDTFLLTGTDEHGQKIQRSAEAAGIPPQQFTDEVSASFQNLWKRMGITNDAFIRTTDAHHKRGAQKLFTQLQKNGFIELRSYTGQYCISDETFVDVPVGAPCPECGRITETVTEENYFFKLSQFQKLLIDLIESEDRNNPLRIRPDSRKNEVLSFLRGNISSSEESRVPHLRDGLIVAKVGEAPQTSPGATKPGAPGLDSQTWDETPQISSESTLTRSAKGTPYLPGALKDLSISRTSVKWGIPVPGDEKHVIYVWLDALSNYMTAIGYGSEGPAEQAKFKKYWPADLHLVGKEIIRFHCVYWPAFLLALNPALAGKTPNDLPLADHLDWAKDWLPKAITAHGWLLFEESKMSKSRGNIVRTETILDAFGTLLPNPAPNDASTSSSETVLQSAEIRVPHLRGGLIAAKVGEAPQTPASLSAPSAMPQEPAANATSAEPQTSVLPKGTTSAEPQTSVLPKGTTSAEPQTSVLPKGTTSAEPQASVLPKGTTSAEPQTSVSLKGTASAVPQQTSEGAALAAEVRLPSLSAKEWKQEQDLFASDVLRYFLLREIPFGQDGSFSFDALVQRYNSDLANGYGNLVSRTLSMIQKYSDSKIPSPIKLPVSELPQHAREYFFGFVSGPGKMAYANEAEKKHYQLRFSAGSLEQGVGQAFEHFDLTRTAENPLWAVSGTDSYLSSNAPWKMSEGVERDDVLYAAAEAIRIITALLYPILPHATAKVWKQLGFEKSIEQAAADGDLKTLQWGGLNPGTKLGPLSPIFPRAPKELIQLMNDMEASNAQKAESLKPVKSSKSVVENAGLPLINNNNDASPHKASEFRESPISSASATASLNPIAETVHPITPHHPDPEAALTTSQIAIDDFIKIDLRVAQIVVAERIPKADKLLRLEVDLGYERRQILSGIAQWYTPEELIGRRIVVIANLAPRKMRGLESHGMLLAASHGEDGKPVLATFAEDIALGSRLK